MDIIAEILDADSSAEELIQDARKQCEELYAAAESERNELVSKCAAERAELERLAQERSVDKRSRALEDVTGEESEKLATLEKKALENREQWAQEIFDRITKV